MKTLHLLFVICTIIFLVVIGESNFILAQIFHQSSGVMNLQLSTLKSNYTDGEIIPISGYTLQNLVINIFLVDNRGNIENSTQVRGNNTGYFNTSLGIPLHVTGGAWSLFAKSGESNFATQIMVNAHGENPPPFNAPSGFAPLKQFKLGIESNYVQCSTDLQLVIKSEDGSPACVKLGTAYVLIKRDWASIESAYPEGNPQFALKTNSTIIPGHLPRSSGLKIPYQESSRVINYTSFGGVYNVTLMFRGTPHDYVLKPGTTGTITFKIEAMASEMSGQQYPVPLSKSLNLTNYAVFLHEITNPADLSKYPGVTMDGSSFSACFTRPVGEGTGCIGGPYDVKGQVEAYVVDHPGVNVLFEPPSEVLPLGTNTTSQTVTMMISVNHDAPQGTYLVELSPSGEFLLTVGSQPYHE